MLLKSTYHLPIMRIPLERLHIGEGQHLEWSRPLFKTGPERSECFISLAQQFEYSALVELGVHLNWAQRLGFLYQRQSIIWAT